MKTLTYIADILLIGLYGSLSVYGISFTLETAAPVYRSGDTIDISAILINNYEAWVDINLDCLFTSQTQTGPDRVQFLPITLAPKSTTTKTLYSINVTDDFPSDQYRVTAKLYVGSVIAEEHEITFMVADTLQFFAVEIYLSKSRTSENEPGVFLRGETIYLSYKSDVEDISVVGTLTFPDGSSQSIMIPKTLQELPTGSYLLEIAASKRGYKQVNKTITFSVIDESPRISRYLLVENFEDGIADGWEMNRAWQVEAEETEILSGVLSGRGIGKALLTTGMNWSNYSLRFKLKLIQGTIQVNYLLGEDGKRYIFGINQKQITLVKEEPKGILIQLLEIERSYSPEVWHNVMLLGDGRRIQIYVDRKCEIDYTDNVRPLSTGTIAFDLPEESNIQIDDIEILAFGRFPETDLSDRLRFENPKAARTR